ncbi:Murein DD-endopeptidase MepM [Flavobacteriales bacterium]|nr:MAG: peptidase M23 [Bacteroidota bacterium]CAG0992298.1 Murein DD-endopeptidase MepM [Flavobacteriales bacterium]
MSKIKYRYNTQTLDYEKVKITWRTRILRAMGYLATSGVIAAGMVYIVYLSVESPKEKILQEENYQLQAQYKILHKRMEDIEMVLNDIQVRDNNIYRVIFEAEPISENIRNAGFGGINRYKHMEGFRSSDLLIETTKRVDKISKQLYIQSKSYDEVFAMAKKKEQLLASIPAIQPVSNKELKYMASGFGFRIDPVYKTTKFHAGIDFTAPIGTPVYATGDGVIMPYAEGYSGYGNFIRINHGYGYVTLYAHLSKIAVKTSQKVKRGDVIGFVGNTGKSVGPHLHYEVRKNDNPINPINFFFNDLTPEEYDRLIQLANDPTQALD